MIARWRSYKGRAQELKLPSAPEHFLTYFDEDDRPQTRLDRDLEGGMGVSIGRLREDALYDYKFVSLSHNTLRGAAGGAVLMRNCFALKAIWTVKEAVFYEEPCFYRRWRCHYHSV